MINRRALDAIAGSFADAMGDMGQAIIDVAKPPDATPFGQGLVTSGGWGVWAGTKKVGGEAQRPKGLRVSRAEVTLFVGFGFPGRFQETGTVHQPARPFLTPAAVQILPQAIDYFRSTFRRIAGKFP